MINTIFYKYIQLEEREELKNKLYILCSSLKLKGTILLAEEGINGNLSGKEEKIQKFKITIKKDKRFRNLIFKDSKTEEHNFKKLSIKERKEIVSLKHKGEIRLEEKGDYIEAKELKKLLDEKEEVILIDARNDYEYKIGKFKNAITLAIENFRDIPKTIESIKHLKTKKIVTYCTGGVRCEKFSTLLKREGFKDVQQLHGGIIQYGIDCGSEYWEGKCFVFDTRRAIDIDPKQQSSFISYCVYCQGPSANYYNCENKECDVLFIACEECNKKEKNCCSKECKEKIPEKAPRLGFEPRYP